MLSDDKLFRLGVAFFLSLACQAVSIKTFSGELFLSLCFDLTLSLTLSQLQAVSQCHRIAVVFEE